MLFQLEALELYFIHPLGFGLTSGTERNIIVVTSAKAGGSAAGRTPAAAPPARTRRVPQPLTGATPLPQPPPSTAAGP